MKTRFLAWCFPIVWAAGIVPVGTILAGRDRVLGRETRLWPRRFRRILSSFQA